LPIAHAPSRSAPDKGYDAADFVEELRTINVRPHVARNTSGRRSAIDRRTTRHPGYAKRTVEGCQVRPNAAQVNEAVNRPKQVCLRDVAFERKLVKQIFLLDLPIPHHRLPPGPA
jgi:hypothetical protein